MYKPWHKWHNDQNGKGSGTCTAIVWTQLLPWVSRHEGATQDPDSHYGGGVKACSELDLSTELEKVVVKGDDTQVRTDV